MKLVLSAATAFIMLCSFATDNAKNWNTKINKSDKGVKEVQKHVIDANTEVILFVKKSDVITLTENEKYTGDVANERHIMIIDNATRKTVYNKELSNTEINSLDINIKKDILKDNAGIASFDILELEVTKGGKIEKKINTYKFNP